MTSGVRRAIGIVALYVALTAIVSWPFVNYSDFGTSSYGGDARLIIWTLAWDNYAVLHGLPLFQSNLFFPAAESLRYNEHLFGVSLFTLPWAIAGASPVLAYNVTWWLSWVLNGLASFALLRRFVRRATAAFIGSLVYVCSFYVMQHAHGHLHLVWTWPLPLSMLLLERWFDRPRWGRAALWALVVLLGALTSWYMAVMVLLVNGLMGLVVLCTAREHAEDGVSEAERWRARAMQLVAAVLVVAALVAPFARHYVGLRGAPGEASANAATLSGYVIPPENTLVGGWWKTHIDSRPGSIWGETTVFAGWTAVLLAVCGLVVGARVSMATPRRWIFPALVVAGVLISLGPTPALPGGSTFAPFYWLSGLPGFEGMRAPGRFALVAMLGVSGLTAGAVAWLMDRLRHGAVVVLLVPVMLAEWYVVGFPAGKPTPFPVPPIYQTAEVRSARALVSLPAYPASSPEWVFGANYLYYSMSHWRPIVNGFGRTEPPDYDRVLQLVERFPAQASALHAMGLQYVIVHADQYPNHGQAILAAARGSTGCRLVLQIGTDYLFELI